MVEDSLERDRSPSNRLARDLKNLSGCQVTFVYTSEGSPARMTGLLRYLDRKEARKELQNGNAGNYFFVEGEPARQIPLANVRDVDYGSRIVKLLEGRVL